MITGTHNIGEKNLTNIGKKEHTSIAKKDLFKLINIAKEEKTCQCEFRKIRKKILEKVKKVGIVRK